jgi:predicted DNA-binding ribbon-helix-helix protein
MASRTKSFSRRPGTRAVRQSVSIPAPLATEVRRVAKEQHLTVSRALVTLAERGVRAERDAKENLKSAYRRFLKEQEPSKKEEAGRDLMRAIFGKDAIAEDPIL